MAIPSFSDKVKEDFFIYDIVKKGINWIHISRIAKRKLDILHYANEIKDLKVMSGNRLKLLKADLRRCCSIRINQWRIIFK